MSIREEAMVFAEGPMMGVFNNLVIYDQHVPNDREEAAAAVRGRLGKGHEKTIERGSRPSAC
jgi:hypothetical protein